MFLLKYYDVNNTEITMDNDFADVKIMDKDLAEIMMNCSNLLENIDPSFPALLIDDRVIGSLSRIDCETTPTKIRVGVDMRLLTSVEKESYLEYEIIYYENFKDRDHLRFYDLPTRIIPRIPVWRYGNLSIPWDTKRFSEFWKRSKVVQCRGMKVVRSKRSRYLPLEKTLRTMSSLRSYLTDFDIYPFLCGGTLLVNLWKGVCLLKQLD
ncbi:hypothetical protein KIN20_006477 [Parelaphostrongylus tenuis]|uniref:W02B3.4-like N-terminal domain-containing protein n=1 Tax=Parelaphostrongylus tenuis TaxID=148309 RepID=A0AAD5MMN7_PARTN|nr:hypothetical protein KIN20_006477 [Parelaphostrongylus tenuis]